MNKKCEKSVRKNPFRPASTPCGKPAKAEREGKWYCGVHDPEGKAAKAREARSQMAQEKWDTEMARSRLDHNRLEVFSEMLDALEAALYSGAIRFPNNALDRNIKQKIETAIAKAKGESND